MTKIVADWMDRNTFHVLRGTKPAGYIVRHTPHDWQAFRADGSFVEWFRSKSEAAGAL